jgi:hypothetical protein
LWFYHEIRGNLENPAIVEGLMWTAIAVVALKRFVAHMTQLLTDVPMSTRKGAMCAVHVLGEIVQALKTGDMVGLSDALEAATIYLDPNLAKPDFSAKGSQQRQKRPQNQCIMLTYPAPIR